MTEMWSLAPQASASANSATPTSNEEYITHTPESAQGVILKKDKLFLIVFLVMFPIIYEAVINGYESLDKNIVNSIKVDAGLHNMKAILNIKIPNLIPYLLLASFQTLGLGMKVSLMAEVLIGNNSINGLGILIRQAYNFAFVDQIMAYSLHAIVIIGLVDIIMYFLKRYLKNKYSF